MQSTAFRRMVWARVTVSVLMLLLFTGQALAQEDAELLIPQRTCASAPFTYMCPLDLVFKIRSITILATTLVDPTPLIVNNTCPASLVNCSRTFKDSLDPGFKDLPEYDYFYKWMFINCQGKQMCNGTMPAPNRLHGVNKVCSEVDVAFFVAVYIDFACVTNQVFPTFAPLPSTTTPTVDPPSTEPTEAPPLLVPIATGGLEERERIVLAVTICAAIIGLFLLLLLLYCCDKWRREKKQLEVLLRLGKPEEKQDAVDEIREFAAKEAWMNETEHPEALGEYCGVKPEEVFTISRKTMDRSDKARQDGAATLQRGVGFGTLQRGAGGDLQSASSMTTLMRVTADKEYVNNAYIPSTFERTDVLHY